MSFEVQDHYFHKAKKENYLARSVYKLQEIDEKFRLFRKGDQVLDIGYYPGSWTQYAYKCVAPAGYVVGMDIQAVNSSLAQALPGVRLYQRDFTTLENISQLGQEFPFNVVISDMAPNTTGSTFVDQMRGLALVESVFYILPKLLRPHGHFVIKVFQSEEAQKFLKGQKKIFEQFNFYRPKAIRKASREFYVVGKNYRPLF